MISCCYSNEKNKLVLTSELSCEMLTNYLEEKLTELATLASINSQANENTLTSTSSSTSSCTTKLTAHYNQPTTDNKFDLAKRFPTRLWKNAIDYFSSAKNL